MAKTAVRIVNLPKPGKPENPRRRVGGDVLPAGKSGITVTAPDGTVIVRPDKKYERKPKKKNTGKGK